VIRGAYVALSTIALAAVFWAVVFYGSDRVAKLPEPKLSTWANSRVLAELGEAQQVGDCSQIIGGPGFTPRYSLSEPQKRLIVVCTLS